ncbi:transposase [Acrocarpospora macrocephala]|uniref:transposase n=1 Tax=Acrocarpospora macrocephala TaxID=150177 RepID=UPI0012D2B096|nr:transposase [Acrocarpospora macrocephala]
MSTQADAIEAELKPLVEPLAAGLLAVMGVSVLTAAKLLGEIGDIHRFRTTGAFARHYGTAPIPVWSGDSEVHRLNRAGNRQFNAAIHRIALPRADATPAPANCLNAVNEPATTPPKAACASSNVTCQTSSIVS